MGDPVYICSDYAYTIQSLRSLGLEDRCRYLIYEDLFSQGTVDGLCDWLGLARHEAVFDRRLNAGVGQSLTATQMALLRDSLAPIYDQLRYDPAVEHASSWLWWVTIGRPSSSAGRVCGWCRQGLLVVLYGAR